MKYARQFDLVITNPLDGSTKYLEEVLDAAHDFLFSDNSVILSEEDEGIDVIGKVILRMDARIRENDMGRTLRLIHIRFLLDI